MSAVQPRMTTRRLASVGVALMLGSACGSEADPLAEFGPADVSGSPLAVVDSPPLDYELQEAYGPGELTLTGDCLFLETADGGVTLLVWPSGSTEWSGESQAVRFTVVGESSTVVRVGDVVEVAGGEATPSSSWLQQPRNCPEGSWAFVTSVRERSR